MSYLIIAGDGKQYGPNTAEQVRSWFAERRLTGQTQIRLENSTVGKELRAVPEFSDLFEHERLAVSEVWWTKNKKAAYDSFFQPGCCAGLAFVAAVATSRISEALSGVVTVFFLVTFFMALGLGGSMCDIQEKSTMPCTGLGLTRNMTSTGICSAAVMTMATE